MSTILKALRRLEDDRSVHEQRPLRETVTSGGDDAAKPSRRRGGWLVALVVLVGIGAGAGMLAFWSVVDGEPVPLVEPAAAPERAAAAERIAVAPAKPAATIIDGDATSAKPASDALDPALETPRELSDAALASRVERLERAPASPRIDDAEGLATVGPVPIGPRTVRGQLLVPAEQLPGRHSREPRSPVVAVAEPEVAPPPAAEPVRRAPEPVVERPQPTRAPVAREPPQPQAEPDPAPAIVERLVPSPQPATPAVADERPATVSVTRVEAPPAPAPKPDTSETSAAKAPKAPITRVDVPDLLVARTSWHPTAARRTATVQVDAGAALEVHEGDAVGPLVVARIEPSSVVFLHEGVEIRRRVGQR